MGFHRTICTSKWKYAISSRRWLVDHMDIINGDLLVILSEIIVIVRRQIIRIFCWEVFIAVKWGWLCHTFLLLVLGVSGLQKLVGAEFLVNSGHDSLGRLLRVRHFDNKRGLNWGLLGQLLEPRHFLSDPLLRQVGGRLLTFPCHVLIGWGSCLALLGFDLVLPLLRQDDRSGNRDRASHPMLVSSPLEHPIQTLLEMRFVFIFRYLLSLISNYGLFLIILLVVEADISITEPFVVILRLGFTALILAILVDVIRSNRVQILSNRHRQITVAVLFHLRGNSFLIWLEHSHIFGFEIFLFLHGYFLVWAFPILSYSGNMIRNGLLWLRRDIILLFSFIFKFGFQLEDLSPLGLNLWF